MANPAFTGCNACGDGAYGVMYCAPPAQGGTGQYAEPSGPSVDQVVARALGPGPVGRPSLNVGVQLQLAQATGGPGESRCFWTGKGQPINPDLDPYRLYTELFAGQPPNPMDAAAVQKLMRERKSVLDYVGDALGRFKARLGAEDRMAMDSHAEAVRQLETQLQAADAAGTCTAPTTSPIDLSDVGKYPVVLDAFVNIVLAAFRCGVTRVATVQLSDSRGDYIDFGAFVPGIPPRGSGYTNPFRSWHDLGHNPVLGGVDQKQILDQWWMSKLAQIIQQMKAIPDPTGGTLFDSSVILWGNDMHEGADHGAQRIPWLLAGKCGGYFKTGQCLTGNTTTMVLADLCEAMGVSVHPFGATMPGLHA
jgi:hypothetical protein